MTSPYRNRLDEKAFQDDVRCEVRLQPDPRDEGQAASSAWIAERLLGRLRHLGLAYDLLSLARLPQNGQVLYSEVQLPALEDELAFLVDVVSDPALLEAVVPIRDLIGRANRDPRGWSLVVEKP